MNNSVRPRSCRRRRKRLRIEACTDVTIRGLTELAPRKQLIVEMYRPSDGRIARFPVRCRIDTPMELEYYKHGGVLNYVLRSLAKPAA